MTTIHIDNLVKEKLEKLRSELGAKTFNEIINILIIEHYHLEEMRNLQKSTKTPKKSL